ncbi:STAS domain-containing protein [Nonomuraea sp. NPDC004186]|uniref:STAS domain-containing protein n=1 Tax=Nonomuraea sp. NPDC049625 TaxID=3155775 RepID=UPI00341A253A
MTLRSGHFPGATLITVIGEVDASNSIELNAYLDHERRRLDEHLIIDVSGLSFLGCSGLAALINASVLARAHNAELHLAGIQPSVARLLTMTDTWQAVTVHDHIEQAIAAMRARGSNEPPETA